MRVSISKTGRRRLRRFYNVMPQRAFKRLALLYNPPEFERMNHVAESEPFALMQLPNFPFVLSLQTSLSVYLVTEASEMNVGLHAGLLPRYVSGRCS